MDQILTKRNLGITSALGVVVILVALGFMLTGGSKQSAFSSKKILTIGNHASINVEVADDETSQAKGLSSRKSLPADQGMLFVFSDYAVRKFWMKNLNFNLDLIWIYDGQVVGIEKNLPPGGESPSSSYNSPGPVNMVLEANAGWADQNQIKVGDVAVLK